MRSRRSITPTLLFAAFLVASATAPSARASHVNAIGNPGLEQEIQYQFGGLPSSSSYGDWLAFSQTNAFLPVLQSAQVREGSSAALIQTPAGGGGAYLLQDVASFPSDASHVLSMWVYPGEGSNQLGLVFDWDRGYGSVAGSSGVAIRPDGTWLVAWGQAVTLPALQYGRWQHLRLTADSRSATARLFVDGALLGTTPRGTVFSGGEATVLMGQASSYSPVDTRFYYDEVALSHTTPADVEVTASPAGGSAFGDDVSFTTVVCPSRGQSLLPSGTVMFAAGDIALGSAPLSASAGGCAQASVQTAALDVGTHRVVATYSGDAHYGDGEATLSHEVAHHTDLSALPAVASLRGSHVAVHRYILQARLTKAASGAGIAGERVEMVSDLDARRILCSATTDATGTASCEAVASAVDITLNGRYYARFSGAHGLRPAHAAAGLLEIG